MKGAWVMHTLRSVINNDKIWFEILKEFAVENVKGFANTRDFFDKVEEKTNILIIGILLSNTFILQINLS